MKIGILGTGMVGTTLGKKLISLGHDVILGSRTSGNDKGVVWAREMGNRASTGTFADAAAFGEILFLATTGAGALPAIEAAGPENLADKVIVDITNPLDMSKGFPPFLFVANSDSLGEQVQKAARGARVVKALNTVTADLMANPNDLQSGDHDLPICGNDAQAKAQVSELLRTFGWQRFVDLGDITNARGTEAYVLLWVRLYGALKTGNFNIKIVR